MAETETRKKRPGAATLALAGAGLIAVAAVGVAIARGGENSAGGGNEAAEANAQQVPDAAETIARLQEQLRRDPDNDQGWFSLGFLLRDAQSFEAAERAFRRAVELRPDNANYTGYLAEALVLRSGGNPPPEAERLFRRALQLQPGHAQARYYLATLRDLRGDHGGAVDDLVALLRSAPPNAPWAPQVRGAAQRIAQQNGIDLAGRLPEPPRSPATAAIPGPSREQMEAARAIPPSQQNEMARGMVERLANRLRQNPRDEGRWIMLMRSRMMLNEPPAAAEALRSALAAFPSDQQAQERLRAAARELGVPGA
jgi:cytochrome c-type biogenesis protein CcmH